MQQKVHIQDVQQGTTYMQQGAAYTQQATSYGAKCAIQLHATANVQNEPEKCSKNLRHAAPPHAKSTSAHATEKILPSPTPHAFATCVPAEACIRVSTTPKECQTIQEQSHFECFNEKTGNLTSKTVGSEMKSRLKRLLFNTKTPSSRPSPLVHRRLCSALTVSWVRLAPCYQRSPVQHSIAQGNTRSTEVQA